MLQGARKRQNFVPVCTGRHRRFLRSQLGKPTTRSEVIWPRVVYSFHRRKSVADRYRQSSRRFPLEVTLEDATANLRISRSLPGTGWRHIYPVPSTAGHQLSDP